MVGTSAWTMHTHYGYYGWMKTLLCSQWNSSTRTEWIHGSLGLIHRQKFGNWGGSQSGGSPGHHDLGNILNWIIQIIGYQWVSSWSSTKNQPTLFFLGPCWKGCLPIHMSSKPVFSEGHSSNAQWSIERLENPEVQPHLGRQRVTPWARRRMLDVGGLGPGDRRGRP